MPDPANYDSQSDWMHECVSTRQDEHPDEDQEQSVAVCLSMWREKKVKPVTKDDNEPYDYEDFGTWMDRCTLDRDEDECQTIWEETRAARAMVHKQHAAPVANMEFVLSDETVDRMGDIIASDGWQIDEFKKNPVCLFNHNPDAIVGKWDRLTVKNGALRGHLQLAPAGISARIDEIRKLVEAGILKATSVGFRPKSKTLMTEKSDPIFGPFRYLAQELMEVSLVSVPANPNALAVAKSMQISDATMKLVFAEHGRPIPVSTRRSANGEHAEDSTHRRQKSMTAMTLPERIQAGEAEIVQLRDQLGQQMAAIDDSNPDTELITRIEDLTKNIETKQGHLEAFKRVEALNAKAAAGRYENNGVVADNRGKGNGSTALTVYNERPFAMPAKKVEPADHLWRALTVAIKHYGERGARPILNILSETYGEGREANATRLFIAHAINKAATVPADTVTSTWALELVQTVVQGYFGALMPLSIYPRLAAKGGSFTFGRNGTISMPSRDTSTKTLAGAFVAQGAPIPVKQGAFSAITLTPKKMGVITTLTREITEHSTPAIEGIVRDAIVEDTAVALDTILIDANAATTIRPAGLKNGVSATTATAGAGMAAWIGDIKALTAAVITGTKGNVRAPVWIMNPSDVNAAMLVPTTNGDLPFRTEMAGGSLLGYPIITSSTVPVDTMFFMDAADFISATGDTPNFSVSDQAVLHMEDTTPAQIGTAGTPTVVAAPTRSLWQTDTIGIRMLLDVNWAMRRTGVIAWTQNMTWN